MAVAMLFGAAGFAATLLDPVASNAAGSDRALTVPREAKRMVLTLVSALTGAIAASRDLAPEPLILTGAMQCAFAAAAMSDAVHHRRAAHGALGALAVVAIFSLVHATWAGLAAGLLAGLPFGIAALFARRSAALEETLVAVLAGVSFGIPGAIPILLGGSLAAIGVATLRKDRAVDVTFAPAVAALALLVNIGELALGGVA